MIEQAIYFALGCIVTALAALAFAPLFWHRALRLTRRRLALQVPLSMQEILAERDQLRAEFAVERLRIEQAMERVKAGKARDMAAIGRRDMAVSALGDEVAALRRLEQAQETEIHLLVAEVAAVNAENGALRVELHDSHGTIERRTRDHQDGRRDLERARNEVEDKRATIASLETRAMGLEMRLTDAQRAGELRSSGLLGKLETAMAHVTRHEASGLSLRRELDEAKLRIHALEEELAGAVAWTGDRGGSDREKGSSAQNILEQTPAGERGQGQMIEVLRAENDALQGALAAARRMPTEDGSADGGLRASIHALGLAVATMSRAARSSESVEDGPGGDRRKVASPADAS